MLLAYSLKISEKVFVLCSKPPIKKNMSDQTPPTPPPETSISRAIPGADKKIPAGILGILLGALGIHKFILGYTKEGVIMLLVTVLTLGILGFIMGVIGLIEGILYLTKSDEEFVATYVTNKKGWF